MPELDQERQRIAKEYAGLSRRLLVVNMVLTFAFLVAAVVVNPVRFIDAWLGPGANYLVTVGVYFLLLVVAYSILTLPMSYYRGYVLPHRFDLSTQTFGAWVKDTAKGGGLSLALGLAMVEVLYLLLQNFPTSWWLIAAAFMLVFSVLMTNLAPILILPLFYRLQPLADVELARRLEDLAARAGARVRGVYVMDMSRRTKAANAALMGLGNTRRIVLGDTLLDDYSPDEIEVVLAHELGHHAHNDIVKSIALET
ncbi:MAG: M48 family metalloprotease, partial [Chloroflexota bacterium]